MSQEYHIRKLNKKDEPQVLDFLKNVFDGWPTYISTTDPSSHWKWKYRDNPLRIDSSIVAEYEGRIVACDLECPKKINIYGHEYLCGAAVDLAVHQDHRGKGLYSQMSKLMNIQRGNVIDFTLASSNNKQVIDRMRRRGNKFFPQKIANFIYIEDIELHFSRSKNYTGFLKKIGYSILRSMKVKDIKIDESITVEKVEAFDESVSSTLSSMVNVFDFSMSYDLEYLNWRYADPRSGDHVILRAINEDTVLGFIVVLLNKRDLDYPIGVIQELVSIDNRVDVLDALLSGALNICREHSVNYIRTIGISGSLNVNRLESAGFIKTDLTTMIWFRPFLIGDGLNQLDSIGLNRMHLAPGFFDAI